MSSPSRTSLESIRKEEILKAALAVIAEKGSANVTLDSIAKAAGFSKGGITYYYASKEVLFKEVFLYFYSFIFARAEKEMVKHEDPLQKILSYAWIYNPNDKHAKVMFPILFDLMSLASYDIEYRQVFHDWVAGWVTFAVNVLNDGNASGQFQVEDVDGTAKLISATMQGIATRWSLDREAHSTEWAIKSLNLAMTSLLNVESPPSKQK